MLDQKVVATQMVHFQGNEEQVIPMKFTPDTQGEYDLGQASNRGPMRSRLTTITRPSSGSKSSKEKSASCSSTRRRAGNSNTSRSNSSTANSRAKKPSKTTPTAARPIAWNSNACSSTPIREFPSPAPTASLRPTWPAFPRPSRNCWTIMTWSSSATWTPRSSAPINWTAWWISWPILAAA